MIDETDHQYGIGYFPEIVRAAFKLENSDGTEVLGSKGEVKGYKIYYENPDTGEKVVVKDVTKYELLEIRYEAEREENTRLLHRLAAQKSENKVLHRKVNDLVHKLRQARRERDELAEKLRIAEADDQKRSLLIETLNQFINKES